MFNSKVLLHLIWSSVAIAILPLVTILMLTHFLISNVEMRENMLYETASVSMMSMIQGTVLCIECNPLQIPTN